MTVHLDAPGRASLCITALLCGVLTTACAPERIPGSTVSQGDAGIAFHRELASLRGLGARSQGVAGTSGSSYGGGSSSSASGLRTLLAEIPDLRVGGKACDWVAAAEPAVTDPTARSVAQRVSEAGTDEWFAANCVSAGELR
jgi:hypothetical protein